ncbi:MAG TPA: hypothetical protein VHQ95_03240 [Pyrinomonadaceae bacterium]|nr:hypothetical protein [Pyrinomonadaceae bacterium]
MWTVLIIIAFWVLFIGLAVFLVIYNKRKERERTQALQQLAATLGWSFAADAPLTQIAWLDRFTLFSQGRSRQIRNFMYGQAQGVKAAVFDYIYVTGSGKSQQTHYQTVVYLEPVNLALPMFSLRPETLFHRMLSAFGYQDIDFGQRPEFSKQYILRGQNELAIRQTFNDRVLSFFEGYDGTCVDAGGNQLFIYRAGQRFQPPEIEGYVGLGLQAMNLLKS